ncbi:unnamed protein product [Cuscuta campestris]|uniref:F-box domain-containing protein n=1 Tax=Cuscuta campestris TaxID=132261 RepID=A0A484N8Y7_9ASTE|nr:unnamed protein product [Cuscuta campestris]
MDDEDPRAYKYGKLCEGRASSRSTQLCDLPDEILILILSFLRMKEAVKTTVLSKRWKNLWAFIPDFHVSQREFPERPLFLDFVIRAFALRNGFSLRKFSISCDILEDAPLIIAWVSFALRLNLQVLNLHLEKPSTPYETFMFDCFLRSESLKVLNLDLPCVVVIPPRVSFPNLKELRVSEIIFEDVDSIEKLFSCSSLEMLSIYQCKWRDLKDIHISAPNLRFLCIDETIDDDNIDFDEIGFAFQDALSYDRRIHINGASIKSFIYNGELINECCILGDTMQLVERARINIDRAYQAEKFIVVPRGFKLLSAVANVKSLSLTHHFLTDLAAGILSMILRRSPHLRSLRFLEEFDHFPRHERDGLLDPVPSCFLTELKLIAFKIDNTDQGFEDQIFAIGLLVKTTTVLEKLEVYYKQDTVDIGFLVNGDSSYFHGNLRLMFGKNKLIYRQEDRKYIARYRIPATPLQRLCPSRLSGFSLLRIASPLHQRRSSLHHHRFNGGRVSVQSLGCQLANCS